MRLLLQILGLLIVACIGWKSPYCDTARKLFPWAQIPPSRLSKLKARAEAAGVVFEPGRQAPATPEPKRTFQSNSPLSQPPQPARR